MPGGISLDAKIGMLPTLGMLALLAPVLSLPTSHEAVESSLEAISPRIDVVDAPDLERKLSITHMTTSKAIEAMKAPPIHDIEKMESSLSKDLFTGIVTCPTGKLHAIGDLHGDFDAATGVMRRLHLLYVDDSSPTGFKWGGGTDCLISTGDISDRGHDFLKIMQLFKQLETQAADAGGKFFFSLGNHELAFNLKRDAGTYLAMTSDADIYSFCKGGDGHRRKHHNGERYSLDECKEVREGILHPAYGEWGKWLFSHPIVIYETTTRSLLMHGGLTGEWLQGLCEDTGYGCKPDHDATAADKELATKHTVMAINYAAHTAILQHYKERSELLSHDAPKWGPNDQEGPLWTRKWGSCNHGGRCKHGKCKYGSCEDERCVLHHDDRKECRQDVGHMLFSTFYRLNPVQQMIVGHTIQKANAVTAYRLRSHQELVAVDKEDINEYQADAKLFMIDVRLSTGFCYKKTGQKCEDKNRDALTLDVNAETGERVSWKTLCSQGKGADNC